MRIGRKGIAPLVARAKVEVRVEVKVEEEGEVEVEVEVVARGNRTKIVAREDHTATKATVNQIPQRLFGL